MGMQDRGADALVFDVGGILVAHDNARMQRRIASRCRPDLTAADLRLMGGDAEWGEGRPIVELYERLRDELGYSASWDVFRRDFCCHLEPVWPVMRYIEMLAGRRRVLLFSNTNAVHWAYVTALTEGRIDRFDRCLSHELGLTKPDVRAFDAVARISGLAPERILFFDDVQANIDGARAAGWRASLFTSLEALRADLPLRE